MTLSNGNWNIKFNQISKPVRVAEMSPDNRTLLTTSMPSTSESYAGSASPSPCRQPSEKSKSFKLWGRWSPSEAPISTNYRSCLQLPSQSLTGAPIHQTPCSSFSSKGPPVYRGSYQEGRLQFPNPWEMKPFCAVANHSALSNNSPFPRTNRPTKPKGEISFDPVIKIHQYCSRKWVMRQPNEILIPYRKIKHGKVTIYNGEDCTETQKESPRSRQCKMTRDSVRWLMTADEESR